MTKVVLPEWVPGQHVAKPIEPVPLLEKPSKRRPYFVLAKSPTKTGSGPSSELSMYRKAPDIPKRKSKETA